MLKPTLTRAQVASAFQCTHTELGQLLRGKRAPLPVRVEGVALWFEDEVDAARDAVTKALDYFRSRRKKAA